MHKNKNKLDKPHFGLVGEALLKPKTAKESFS